MTSNRRVHHPASRMLAVVAALVAGCGTVAPTVAPTVQPTAPPSTAPSSAGPATSSDPAAAAYAAIRTQVEELRGLAPTKAVEPVTIDEAQLRENLEAELDKQLPPDALAFENDLLGTLGLLPAGSNLRDIYLDFQAGQGAGYYSPDKDELYVVSRGTEAGGLELVTYAHEFTHQLQDQHFPLESFDLDARDQRDRSFGRLALIEGDATSVQVTWLIANLTPEQIGEVLKAGLDPAALEALQRAPAYVRETSLFSYEQGLAFVNELMAGGGYDPVNAAYAEPPASTEQVIHPEKYLAGEAPAVVEIPGGVAAAMGSGWTVGGEDTLGEEVLDIWLGVGKVPATAAGDAAAGWGGDRVVLLRGPDGALGVGLITTWDTAADAAEFSTAAATALETIDPDGLVVSDGIRRVIVALGDGAPEILAALAG